MEQATNLSFNFNYISKVGSVKYLNEVKAYPFLKWAGGKRTLIPEIRNKLPKSFNNYYEPFVGGGSVFFSLSDRIKKAYLSDTNHDLMFTYQILKIAPHDLIRELKKYQIKHGVEFYKRIREQDNQSPVKLAARLIYLNKTCYNGLYRVNQSGKFNVPIGKYTNPTICDEENLLNVGKVLKQTTLNVHSFGCIKPKQGDLVYCDPPYDETFTSYTSNGFNESNQRKLKECCDKWKKAGAFVIISNNNTGLIRELYKKYRLIEVKMARSINCNAQKRNKVTELLILGY